MLVSFAGPECESEGLKSPCAGGGSHPQNYQQVTSVARAPSAAAEDRDKRRETKSHHPAAKKSRCGNEGACHDLNRSSPRQRGFQC